MIQSPSLPLCSHLPLAYAGSKVIFTVQRHLLLFHKWNDSFIMCLIKSHNLFIALAACTSPTHIQHINEYTLDSVGRRWTILHTDYLMHFWSCVAMHNYLCWVESLMQPMNDLWHNAFTVAFITSRLTLRPIYFATGNHFYHQHLIQLLLCNENYVVFELTSLLTSLVITS